MDDIALEIRNAEAISRSECRYLEMPAEGKPCAVCNRTGFIPGTDTEESWGDACPNGCPADIQAMRDRAFKPAEGR